MNRWIRIIAGLFTSLTGLACLLILLMVAIILGDVLVHGLPGVTWEFVSTAPSEGMTEGGIFPAIFGTVALVILMTIAVVPLGVAAAVYLQEYASQDSRLVHLVRLALQNLAGVPAIVFGLFGLGLFVQFVGGGIDQIFFPTADGPVFGKPCILWAALTLAVLTLPTVVVATEEALRAVPRSYREAAYAMGATRWQVVRHVVLPQSIGGVLTGTILAVSRGAGEVAPIMFTGAAYYLRHLPTKLNDQFMELGYHVYVLATQSPDVEQTKPILYSTVLVLLVVTFALNIVAVLLRSQIRRRLRTT
ncbi:MAG TPA: phosphate ABC transporter permease PstA [Planctomycetota bacterium]|nr:phosphate ABC transporter permease PstA [Planctomycetota bacterium]